MIEAVMYMEISIVYSAVLSLSSMEVAVIFNKLHMIEVGFAIILVVFCCGGLGLIAFAKQRVGKETFNLACSLASAVFASILLREGSVQRGTFSIAQIAQVWINVHLGVLISAGVCLTVNPYTAVSKLKRSFVDTLDTYAEILNITVAQFLGAPAGRAQLEAAAKDHHAAFTSMEQNMREAKFEHFVRGTEEEYFIQRRMVTSIQSLAQYLGSLKSSLTTQKLLISETAAADEASCEELFKIFEYHLAPPMKSLTYTLKLILEDLPFGPAPAYELSLHERYKPSLRMAVHMYSAARVRALKEVYAHKIFSESSSCDIYVDQEEVASTCGQFSYVLEDLSTELLAFLGILEDYQHYLSTRPPRSWWWLLRWRANPRDAARQVREPPAAFALSDLSEIGAVMSRHPAKEPLSVRVWQWSLVLRRSDVRFGIKVGVGSMVYALPAFIPLTRGVFSHWRLEWGLVAFVIVMNISIGGTTMSSYLRLLGTFLGCVVAVAGWTLFPDNALVLPVFGFVFAIPCMYINLNWRQNNGFGRIMLLAYNLVALYTYSVAQIDTEYDDDDDDEGGSTPIVGEIGLHRMVSVSIGVLWGLFVTVYVWPISARSTLKRRLSILWVHMGLIWRADPLNSLTLPAELGAAARATGIHPSIGDEHELQHALVQIQPLIKHSESEFRLKGPFPGNDYRRILRITQDILHYYQIMSIMIAKDHKASAREADIIADTAAERRELSDRIFLIYYLLASSIRMGIPLPEQLPSTDHARDRMIIKINRYRMKAVGSDGSDEDFVLFYTYILATLFISEGLNEIAKILHSLIGYVHDDAFVV
ncbi:Fusaric acid resistance protein-like-domain-containing protein [Dipodascopsis tothii]|uniref:Fusaric acid resistance protein-like-domain-containing protein n=1 Tax=Dipodascopsis tothii TaxID=44089 RepID=UPI0034CFC99E